MSIDLENLRIFVKVAELGSFTGAGSQLGQPKSRISLRVSSLEAELGSRLFQRTTRAVRLTPDGEQLLARARALVEEADELAALFQSTSNLKGRVRVDIPVGLARSQILPKLPELYAQHPQLELLLSITDQRVDIVRDGFDCVMRVGIRLDPGLVAKRLGVLTMTNCVSASYVRRYGIPRSIADLDRHLLVHYSLSLGGDEPTFEYRQGNKWVTRPMKSLITVNNTDAFGGACRAGLGIIQVPTVGVKDAIASGELVEVLPEHTCEPLAVSLVHTHGRALPKRVRAVMNFLADAVAPALAR